MKKYMFRFATVVVKFTPAALIMLAKTNIYMKHPEKYEHLLIRLCGFSAKFTSLNKEWQQEVINRKNY